MTIATNKPRAKACKRFGSKVEWTNTLLTFHVAIRSGDVSWKGTLTYTQLRDLRAQINSAIGGVRL